MSNLVTLDGFSLNLILDTFKTVKKIQMWLSWTSVSGILHEDLIVHYIVDSNNIAITTFLSPT